MEKKRLDRTLSPQNSVIGGSIAASEQSEEPPLTRLELGRARPQTLSAREPWQQVSKMRSPQLTFGKRVSRRGREKRDSEEVWLHNFVTLGGVVHGMRKLWRPYSQSYFWAEPPKIMVGQGVVSTT